MIRTSCIIQWADIRHSSASRTRGVQRTAEMDVAAREQESSGRRRKFVIGRPTTTMTTKTTTITSNGVVTDKNVRSGRAETVSRVSARACAQVSVGRTCAWTQPHYRTVFISGMTHAVQHRNVTIGCCGPAGEKYEITRARARERVTRHVVEVV